MNMRIIFSTLLLAATATACRPSAPTEPPPVAAGAEASGAAATAPAEGSNDADASAQAPAEQVSLLIYCGRNEEMLRPLFELYQQETGVTITAQYAGSAELAATLLEEGDRARADLFLAQDVATLGLLESQGRLAPLPQDVVNAVPANFRSPGGRWVGVSGRARVLAYNTAAFAERPLPTDVDGLLDPAYRGRLGWAPENASFQAFVAAMVAERGEEATRTWLNGIKANEPRAYPSNTPMVVATGRGEIDAALTNHYYLYRVQAENNNALPVANHYFRNGRAESLMNAAGVGIVATSANTDAALAFVRWLLGETAQRYFAERTYEHPLATGVNITSAAASLPSLTELALPTTDLGALGNLEVATRLLTETGVLQ